MRSMATDDQNRPLPPNTFYYKKKGFYRYKKPNGKLEAIRNAEGKTANYDEACDIAERANSLRDSLQTSIKSLAFWVDKYIEWAEKQNPKSINKQRWKETKSSLIKFSQAFSYIAINQLQLNDLLPWWDALTYDQQHNRKSAFNKFFSWLIANGVCEINPFTNADHLPRLIKKPKPEKSRAALEMADFWKIYSSELIEKYPHVKIAMGISLLTAAREADICSLTFKDNVASDSLNITVSKSANQRGHAKAEHHQYLFSEHPTIKKLINLARELSLKHKRCPFVLSYHQRGQREQMGDKTHISQVRPKKLSRDFALIRNTLIKAGEIAVPRGKNAPTFHEIKGLFTSIALGHYSLEDVQKAASHMDQSTTLAYPNQHKPVYKPVNVVITPDMIGGEL